MLQYASHKACHVVPRFTIAVSLAPHPTCGDHCSRHIRLTFSLDLHSYVSLVGTSPRLWPDLSVNYAFCFINRNRLVPTYHGLTVIPCISHVAFTIVTPLVCGRIAGAAKIARIGIAWRFCMY